MQKVSNGNFGFNVNVGSFLTRRQKMRKVMMVMLAGVVVFGIAGITQAAMYKYDDFSNTANSNSLWTKDVDSNGHGKVYFNDEDGDGVGVGVADIRMYTGYANKHAWITSNMTIDYPGSGDVRVTYDLKLYQDTWQSWLNGFVLILPNQDRVEATTWGDCAGGANAHKARILSTFGGNTSYQWTSTALSVNTWYHYDIVANASGVVMKIYPHDPSGNNDPDWYVNNSTPRDTLSASVGLSAGSYVMKFYVNNYSGDDTSSNPRANIYVDNVYTNVPEPATIGLLAIGTLGFIRKK